MAFDIIRRLFIKALHKFTRIYSGRIFILNVRIRRSREEIRVDE